MSKEAIAVFGASSLIAQETLRAFAKTGDHHFVLVGRDSQKLGPIAKDLEARGSTTEVLCGNILEHTFQVNTINHLKRSEYPVSTALLAWGSLGNPDLSRTKADSADEVLQINLNSYVRLIPLLIPALDPKGTLAVISSVAGDRGKARNFVYDAAKAGLSEYLSGLRAYYSKKGFHVLTIKPGIVDTPMTAAMKKGLLAANPKPVGEGIFRAIKTKADVVYVPWFWRYIMLIIKSIPERLFKKLDL